MMEMDNAADGEDCKKDGSPNTTQEEAVAAARDIELIENVRIQTVTTQMSFTSMMDQLEKGYYVIPGFQRMYRWSEFQVEELAISLVRGLPIPPIYCFRNSEQQVVILDGQQRMLSLYLYYIGKYLKRRKNAFVDARTVLDDKSGLRECLEEIGLVDKKYSMRYEGENGEQKDFDITYCNLSERLKRRIDFAAITLVEINVDSEAYRERTLHKIFANLNIGGTPLSSQELRNGIYGCDFYDMLYKINETNEKWRQLYSGDAKREANKAGKDVELLLQMCAFKHYVTWDGEKFTLRNYTGKISRLLDDFSKNAVHFKTAEIKEYEQSLSAFVENMEVITGKGKATALVSIFTVWDKTNNHTKLTQDIINKIVDSKNYTDTIISGTSAKGEIEKRLGSVYEILSGYDK